MGCGSSVVLVSGRITCIGKDCSRPAAAAEILADTETEHIVVLTQHDFTIRHPLRERLDDLLMQCLLHRYLEALSGPPFKPGRYRVTGHGDIMENWEKIG
jgi:hypothetical protein